MSSAVRKQMEIYQPIIEGMLSIAHLEWTLAAICETVVSKLGYRMIWIGAVDKRTHEIKPISHKGLGEDLFSSIGGKLDGSPSGGGATGAALRSRMPVVGRDISSDPAYASWREQVAKQNKSYVVLPVEVGGDVIGLLNIFSDREDAFKPDEVEVLRVFSQAVAVAMDKSKGTATKSVASRQAKDVQMVPQRLIHPGGVYIYGGSLEESLQLFKNHLNRGWQGLVVADKSVVEKYGKGLLRGVPSFRFTSEIGSPDGVWTYSGLSILISSLIHVTQKPLALIDSPEVLENGPERGYLGTFVEDLYRDISQRNAAAIIRMEKIEGRLLDTLKKSCRFL